MTDDLNPRIAPLPPQRWPREMKDALAPLSAERYGRPPQPPGRPKGLNVLGTFAHHPTLAAAFVQFNAHVMHTTTLTERQRELVVLRVATVYHCDYEWAQHEIIAGDFDITADDLDRIAAGPDAPGWSPFDSALLRAVDELVADAQMGEDTYAALRREFDEQQVLDLVFTVGAYGVLAMALNVCGTPLDDDLRPPA